ncbi:MAG: hypothetical protein EZS28_042013 [Streblomastix strix]|uniref:Uncharacterized protein n=1 Tax=Streblomastix strix TaxID=222440 RepID=A0A5J4TWL2_9EUKA|nr:MAG: hypothetical protein EZS28_042013 [Streblomastix strix]
MVSPCGYYCKFPMNGHEIGASVNEIQESYYYQQNQVSKSKNFTDEALLTIGFAAFSDNPSYRSNARVSYMNKLGDRVILLGYQRIQRLT